jgi:alpha-D-xyloside xylohydrolase
MAWNDAARTLTFGARAGSFAGMPRERTFNVVLVSPGGPGYGVVPAARAVTYKGDRIAVTF